MSAVPDATAPHWVRAMDLAQLRARGRAVVKFEARQIALFVESRADGERIYACNNRCPHEGYPLVEGHTSTSNGACRLTCHYHNWAFDLDMGANVYGGDRLRVYPVRVHEDTVWLDLSDPPVAERVATTLAALDP
jgi:nitrite reductase/ring-hydroxylating ferredoxin subunit